MSGEPPDSEDSDILESLLELFLKDTLQEAEESFCANRLVDSDEEVPPSPDPSEDTKDWLARTEIDREEPAFPESLKLLGEATSSVSDATERGRSDSRRAAYSQRQRQQQRSGRSRVTCGRCGVSCDGNVSILPVKLQVFVAELLDFWAFDVLVFDFWKHQVFCVT
ncbi:hypothetical protein Esti_006797 [Eimeria stiedai]